MPDYTHADRNGMVKTVAVVALMVALIALAWAVKADLKANEATKKAREAYNSNPAVPLDNDDNGDESMRSSTDSEGDLEPQAPTDTGAPNGTGVNSQGAQ